MWKGALDRYAESSKGKKGTTAVDDEFLKDMNEWRLMLARNIALRNDHVKDEQQLNYAVQMTIDRVIFLRICEDRGIEPEEQLKNLSAAPGVYPRLLELFRHADLKYNSGLFNFTHDKDDNTPPDTFTPTLAIDDRVLKEFIKDIYYPCPYIFKEIPVEILGQVYEQFLGQVIRLTAGHQAKVEEKPEVRKADGVYYTPKYIVDYIVANTVGKLLEGKTPAEAAALKIVDPACGSGSFLLGAFQYLIDWHEKWYLDNDPGKWTKGKVPALNEVTNGYRLTTLKKKEILLNNIHGVDIDAQAVEVTKLSLLLKVLEEETGQLSLGLERALPDLGKNIQCGNSLIGEDYFAGRLVMDPAERRRVNPFEWERSFPEVFAQGGFNAVIGNPPYIRIQEMREWASGQVDYFKYKYVSATTGNYDIYVIFVERTFSIINKIGLLGFILPSKFFTTDYGNELRNLIAGRKALFKIVDFSQYQVFENATTYTNLLFLSGSPVDKFSYSKVASRSELEDVNFASMKFFEVGQRWEFTNSAEKLLVEKLLKKSTPLGSLPSQISRGSSSGADNVFIIKEIDGNYFDRLGRKVQIESNLLRKPVYATDFNRYQFSPKSSDLIIFPYILKDNKYVLLTELELKNEYPLGYKYLASRKKELEQRKDYKYWFGFSATRNLEVHEKSHFLVPLLADRGKFCLFMGNKNEYCLMASGGFSITINNSALSQNFILGLLNSKLLFWRLKSISNIFMGGWITCTKQYVETLPIRSINFSDTFERITYEQIVKLVDHILDLHKRTAITPQEQEQLRREIESTDRQIDKLVYQLYGLTEEEIRIVEGSNNNI